MGIREEIEKTKVDSSLLTPPYPRSHLDHLQTHNEAIDLVLSILDSHYECILEGKVADLQPVILMDNRNTLLMPGDVITILRKRK